MRRAEVVAAAGRLWYLARTEGPEVKCPACGERVQGYHTSSLTVAAQIKAAMRHHLKFGGCAAFPERGTR